MSTISRPPTQEGSRHAQAVERLATAARTRVQCDPVRDLIGLDVDAAYEVQATCVARALDGGRRVVGRKIGLTSRVVQAQLGVDQPDFGVLLDDMAVADRQPVPLDRFLQPKVEAEVAFVLDRDLDVTAPTVADVISATAYVLPAIEVVDSRIRGWDITISDTVADNASSGAFVLGTVPRDLRELDLAAVGAVLEVGGEPVATGVGANCLGSPTVAVAWLAGEVARRGAPLRAGEVVLSGALGPVVPVDRPGVLRARFDGLGTVHLVLVEASQEGQR